jgi:PAS domain S-box-containing protein
MELTFIQQLADLKQGEHLCALYETEQEQLSQVSSFLERGLQNGEKLFYISDDHTCQETFKAMRKNGIPVDESLESGQLAALTDEGAYRQNGGFNASRMIAMMRQWDRASITSKGPGVRVAAEATWLLRGLLETGPYLELETALKHFLPVSRCCLLIQYDRWAFDSTFLLDVLSSHPVIVEGTNVYENIYYVPAEELHRREIASITLGLWLENTRSFSREANLLRSREASIRSIFNAVDEAIFVHHPETFEVVETNQGAERMFGYSREEMVHGGMAVFDVEGTGSNETRLLEVMRKVAGGEPQLNEWVCRHRDGYEVIIETKGKRANVAGSDFLITTARDITWRKQAELENRRNLEVLQDTMESINDGYIALDAEMVVVYANHRAEELGLRKDEAIGKKAHEISPYLPDSALEELEHAFRKREQAEFEMVVRSELGHNHYIVRVFPLEDGGAAVYFTDVTRGRHLEQALEASEEKYRLLFENSSDAILLINEESWSIVEFNPMAREMFGIKDGGAGIFLKDFMSSATSFEAVLEVTTDAGAPRSEWLARRSDGQTFWVGSRQQPVTIKGHKLLLMIIRDISFRKRVIFK